MKEPSKIYNTWNDFTQRELIFGILSDKLTVLKFRHLNITLFFLPSLQMS